jgi:hypothetical protein
VARIVACDDAKALAVAWHLEVVAQRDPVRFDLDPVDTGGLEPDTRHELARRAEAQEVLQFGHERHGGDELRARIACSAWADSAEGPCRQRVAQGLLCACDALRALGCRVQVLRQGDVLCCMRERDGGQPVQVRGGPRAAPASAMPLRRSRTFSR